MSFHGQGAPHKEFQSQYPCPSTYLEYLEFSSKDFEKFKHMPTITAADILNVDTDKLCEQLQNPDRQKE